MHRAFVQHPVSLSPSLVSRRLSRSPVLQIASRAASTSNPAYSSPLSEQRARQATLAACPALEMDVQARRASTIHCFQLRLVSHHSRASSCVYRDREASARRAALQEIVSELTRTITRNGQRGVQRTFQALQAAVSISTEYVTNFQQGIQDPPQVSPQSLPEYRRCHIPCICLANDQHAHILGCILVAFSAMGRALLCELQVVLRKLFERLGATYIKLGESCWATQDLQSTTPMHDMLPACSEVRDLSCPRPSSRPNHCKLADTSFAV